MKTNFLRLLFLVISFTALLASSCASSAIRGKGPVLHPDHQTAGSQSAKPFAPPSTRDYPATGDAESRPLSRYVRL